MRSEKLDIRAQFPEDFLGGYYRAVIEGNRGEEGRVWGADDPQTAKDLIKDFSSNSFDYDIKHNPPDTLRQVNKIFNQLAGGNFSVSHFWTQQLKEPLFSVSAKEQATGEIFWVLGGKARNKYTNNSDESFFYFGPIGNNSRESGITRPILMNLADFVINSGWEQLNKCKKLYPDIQPMVCRNLESSDQFLFRLVLRATGAYFATGQVFVDEGKRLFVLCPTAYTSDLGLYVFQYGEEWGNERGLALLSPECQGYVLSGFSFEHRPPYYLFESSFKT